MKKALSVLLMSIIICSSGFAAKDRLPADLSGVKMSPVKVDYLPHEGKFNLSFAVTVPANYFERRVTFVLMPSLTLIDDEVIQLPQKGVQGTSVMDTNYPVVDWSKEQVIVYSAKVFATSSLIHSVLNVDVYLHNCLSKAQRVDKLYAGPLNPVIFPIAPVVLPADVVVAGAPAEAKPEGRIFFKVNSSTITKEGTNNPSIQQMNEMIKFLMNDASFTITQVDVYGSASPEGTDRVNKPLAANRAKSGVVFMKQNLKNLGYKKELTNQQYTIVDAPNFWEGFLENIANSNHPKKDEIITEFLGYQSDPARLEKEVRELMKEDQAIREIIFPDLRYAAILVKFNQFELSKAQLEEAAHLYPGILSAKDMSNAAEAEISLEKKAAIYRSAIKQYPGVWQLYANLGNVYLKMQDYEAARKVFINALQASPNNPTIKAQMAYTYLAIGDYTRAKQALDGVTGPEADYYRGLIAAVDGKYNDAIPLLKSRPDINLAIVYLNAGKTKEAMDVLNKLEQEDAYTAFYTAVALRRMNRITESDLYFQKAQRLGAVKFSDDRLHVDYYNYHLIR